MTTDTTNLKKAIDIMTDINLDYSKILQHIAKHNPAALIRAYDCCNQKPKSALQIEAETLLQDGRKIPAIKALREAMNLTLKDAKEACDLFTFNSTWPTGFWEKE
jgi:ribosomal protein L7/L12